MLKSLLKNLLALTVAAICVSQATAAEEADSFPQRPVRLLVGFAAGGASDMIARVVAERLSKKWNQPVVVDNRVGASGIVAGSALAKAAPDGYTLGLQSVTQTILPALGQKLPYDIVTDFTPIARGANIAQILVVGASPRMASVRSMEDLLSIARQQPKVLTYSSGGTGTTPQLSAEIMRSLANVEVLHVPYKGGAPAVADVMSGQIDYTLANAPEVIPLVNGGRLRPLAVTSRQRLALLPSVPSIGEKMPGFDVIQWFGFFGPPGLPKEILVKINADIVEALRSTEVKNRLEAMGVEPAPTSSEEFAAEIKRDLVRWAQVVKSLGVKVGE